MHSFSALNTQLLHKGNNPLTKKSPKEYSLASKQSECFKIKHNGKTTINYFGNLYSSIRAII